MTHNPDDDDAQHYRMKNAFRDGLKKRGVNPDDPPPVRHDEKAVAYKPGDDAPSSSAKMFELRALLNDEDIRTLARMAPKKPGRRPRDVVFEAMRKVADDPDFAWITDKSLPAPTREIDGVPGTENTPVDPREGLMDAMMGVLTLGSNGLFAGVSGGGDNNPPPRRA